MPSSGKRIQATDGRHVPSAGDCYTDTASVCFSDPNPVVCESANGANVCCPQYTSCTQSNHTERSVRCQINSLSLSSRLASSTSSSQTTSTSTSISTSTSPSTSTSTSTSAVTATPVVGAPSTGSPESTSTRGGSQNNGLSGGIIAGIVLGSVAIIGIAFLAGWLILRRKKIKAASLQSHFPPDSHYSNPAAGIYPKQELDAQGAYHAQIVKTQAEVDVDQGLLAPRCELDAVDSVRGRIERS